MAKHQWFWGLGNRLEVKGELLSYRQLLLTGEVPLSSVTSVEIKHTFLYSTVLVHIRDAATLELVLDKKAMAKEIFEVLNGLIAARQPRPSDGTSTGSIADEIRKLAALRDAGILTEAEFQGKKKQLLR